MPTIWRFCAAATDYTRSPKSSPIYPPKAIRTRFWLACLEPIIMGCSPINVLIFLFWASRCAHKKSSLVAAFFVACVGLFAVRFAHTSCASRILVRRASAPPLLSLSLRRKNSCFWEIEIQFFSYALKYDYFSIF